MKKSFQIGSAFVGLIVGAGFASGQEVMQYFTSFGIWGTVGGIVATLLFIFLGFTFAQLGTDLQAASHKGVIYHIGGRYIGAILDILITFFLFGVAVVMFAGSGSTFEQMFGINTMTGSIIMVTLTILTLLLNTQKIIGIIASITPYLIAIIFIILIYSIFTTDLSLAEADAIAKEQASAASNWLLSAFLYVSYNLAAGAALLIVMSGGVKDRKVAGWGGILGGIMLGGLIILIHIGMFMKIDVVAGMDMPTLALAEQIHPFIGILMAIALLGMMYNTAVGMFYSFTVRFIDPDSRAYKPAVVMIGLLGFAASFAGFTTLVGKVYSTMGYLGFALIIAAIIAWFRRGNTRVS
ncbi:membrane protein [Oceanobacillus oncorhynchi subsp. oncorhynchi]|uniref:YkvI family membrane protein n=1 Tax=Oceanobacillus oncorhynchi TaxID=545501 RepID=UPI0031E38208